MGRGITIIKLGGSVITDKSVPYKLEERNIYNIAFDISNYGGRDIVLVHGGGSIGHYLVETFGLDAPSKSTSPVHVSTLSFEMDKLTNRILEIFLEEGVPVFSVPTHAVLSTRSGAVNTVNLSVIKRMLSLSYIPLMKGDVVVDSEQGFSIFSGDDLSALLAIELNASRVVFLIDMDGIIGPDGKVIKRLRVDEYNKHLVWPMDRKFDVTGGLQRKLDAIKMLVQRGVQVLVLSPRVRGRLLSALSDKPFLGTEVVP